MRKWAGSFRHLTIRNYDCRPVVRDFIRRISVLAVLVTVFSLIAKGTIEEKIRHLQEMKRELAEQVLAGENGTLGSLRREELLELLADTP